MTYKSICRSEFSLNSSCTSDIHLSPVSAHQAAAPSPQTTYRNSISNLWDWEVPLCTVYVKLQDVGITMETTENCPNY